MKKVLLINKDTEKLKKKLQTIYAFTLVILTMIIFILNLTLIHTTSADMTLRTRNSTLFLTIIGSLLSIPTYALEIKIEKANLKQLKILNYLFNTEFAVLFLLLGYIIYYLFSLTLF